MKFSKIYFIYLFLIYCFGFLYGFEYLLLTKSYGFNASNFTSDYTDTEKNVNLPNSACTGELLPFFEGFNMDSSSLACWKIIDSNNDAVSNSNLWRVNSSMPYEGNQAMYFNGQNNIEHDDWLISPEFTLSDKSIYKLTYYYKTGSSNANSFEVLLSKNGTKVTDFTTTLVPLSTNSSSSFAKKEVFISNTSGDINIAWHIMSSGTTTIYIDGVSLEEVNCIEPQNLEITKIGNTTAQFVWTDPTNTSWQYQVVKNKDLPTIGWINTNNTLVDITQDANNLALLPNTMYQIYLRAICKSGKYSSWLPPIQFTTSCVSQSLPFFEGFNKNSSTLSCWSLIDKNKDATSPIGNNLWRVNTSGPHEGDQLMYINAGSNTRSDDYLISPPFNFVNKNYKITYYIKTASNINSEYEVLLYKDGIDFKKPFQVLQAPIKTLNGTYTKKELYVSGVQGMVQLAWHAVGGGTISIDSVSVEEVTCISPTNINLTSVSTNAAEFQWNDPSNKEWEYSISAIPNELPKGGGIHTTSTSVKFLVDDTGQPLKSGHSYGFYVRSICNGQSESWVGPFIFTTTCNSLTLPFDESFDTTSNSFICWNVLDINEDATSPTGNNLWKKMTSGTHQGNGAMMFNGVSGISHNDYLVTPGFFLDKDQLYQISYFYKTATTNDNSFRFLMNQNNMNFSSAVILKSYDKVNNINYTQETLYVEGKDLDVYFAFYVTAENACTLYIDSFEIQKVDCVAPGSLGVAEVSDTSVGLTWVDTVNTSWEYYVQKAGFGLPAAGGGTMTNITTVSVSTESNGQPLVANESYEFFVRSICANTNLPVWIGPYSFNSLCKFSAMPFNEDFETNSASIACWNSVDVNQDATAPNGNNLWRINASGGVKGRAMTFNGVNGAGTHDDYLISPSFELQANTNYLLTYSYKTSSVNFHDNTFSVKLANKVSREPHDFTTILVPSTKYTNTGYIQKQVYIKQAAAGSATFAWHVTGKDGVQIYIDDVSLVKIDCIVPDEVTVVSTSSTDATIVWKNTDAQNTAFNYYVQNSGLPAPISGGVNTTSNSITVASLHTAQGGALLANTEYDFYIRSFCGSGKYSTWVGPIKFRTNCSVGSVPFIETFEANSPTLTCWSISNSKGNLGKIGQYPEWTFGNPAYQGVRSLRLAFNDGMPSTQWVISPLFTTSASKYYRLKYNYVGNISNIAEVSVYSSNTKADVVSMTNLLVDPVLYNSYLWKTNEVVFKGVAGQMSIGFKVEGKSTMYLNLDDISIEEIVGCPGPFDLNVKNQVEDNVTLFWNQNFKGDSWEYIVQSMNDLPPSSTTIGIQTQTKEVVVNKDSNGNPLKSNTQYTYWVRTKCVGSGHSVWVGPFSFYTACSVLPLPFIEGFDTNSATLKCWSIENKNNDLAAFEISRSEVKQGNASMSFVSSLGSQDDDWLITPTFDLQATKTYRLKYFYLIDNPITELEILASNSGTSSIDFKKVIKPVQNYTNSKGIWQQEFLYVTGIQGVTNFAIHVVSKDGSSVFIEEFTLSEVLTCQEPIAITNTNIGSDNASFNWVDASGATQWEFFVQKAGQSPVKNKDKGKIANAKFVVADFDHKQGTRLEANTAYEFYVRSICSNGEVSIWSDPYLFITTCKVYSVPFLETFETSSTTRVCWEYLDVNSDHIKQRNAWTIMSSDAFQGKAHAGFEGASGFNHDDYLISPTLNLIQGNYLLKFRYKTNDNIHNENQFELLLSNAGKNVADFKTILIKEDTYATSSYKEMTVEFTASGLVNLAWHVVSKGATKLYVDQVEVKLVETCSEPTNVQMLAQTGSTIDLTWDDKAGINEWEVLLVDVGEAVNSVTGTVYPVIGQPKTTLSPVASGKVYWAYVRSICADKINKSDWSTPIEVYTHTESNDDCNGAIVLNASVGLDSCENAFKGITTGATRSNIVAPRCFTNAFSTSANAVDIWFEYTAVHAINNISIRDILNLDNGDTDEELTFFIAIYKDDCSSLGDPEYCFSYNTLYGYIDTIKNMVPGQKYLIRLGYIPQEKANHMFELCISTHNGHYLEVSPSGTVYSTEVLVSDVLVKSDCELVTNIRYQNGDGSSKAMSYNTIGYFNKGQTDFPFDEGIVLSTNEVQYVPGPAKSTFSPRGNNGERWEGDKDINDLIADAGGAPFDMTDKRVTQLEFDFIPIKEAFKFEYLFASNSYHAECTTVECYAGAMFGAWLIDTETGVGQNLAKVPYTNKPITLTTVVDNTKAGKACPSSNEEYYWKHYAGSMGDNPIGASIDFTGLTTAMSSEQVYLVPGRKYHIKLAVIDFCGTKEHSSAVFFKGGSFDLGTLDLGADLTVANNNAICADSERVIESGLGGQDIELSWYKDGQLIANQNEPDLIVNESGVYKVVGYYPTIKCEVVGEITAELYPSLDKVILQPKELSFCRLSQKTLEIDLHRIAKEMLSNVNEYDYKVQFYNSIEEAKSRVNAITNQENFSPSLPLQDFSLFVLVEDLKTGCNQIFENKFNFLEGEKPTVPADVFVCDSYVLPALEPNHYYFGESGGQGEAYKAGDVLLSGKHTIYVLKDNGDGCYEEGVFTLTITPKVLAPVFEDVYLSCGFYTLEPLLDPNATYFVEFDGKRVEVEAGTLISLDKTIIFVQTKSIDGMCIDESSFSINYLECPIPKGISPQGDGKNDRFDLSKHGVSDIKIFNRLGTLVYSFEGEYTDQWNGESNKGLPLPSGTYFYTIVSFNQVKTGWVQLNR